jgi:lipopolysaccharide exporter
MPLKKVFSSYWIRSAFYSILQRFSITLFGLINFIVLIRSLTKPQMGAWALFLVVISIFETTKIGLLKNAHIRFVSSSNDIQEKSAIASASLLINSALTIIFILLIVFFADWLSNQLHTGMDLSIMLKWFIPGLISMVFFSHLEAIQQSHLDFKGVFAGYFVRQIVFFLGIAGSLLLHFPFSLRDVVLYLSFGYFAGTLTLYFYSRKYLSFRFNPSVYWIKQIFGYGKYIFASGAISNIFSNLDQLMTGRYMTSTVVAYYTTASRVNVILDIPSYAAADILFPKSARALVEEGAEKVRYLFERMVGILLSFSIPIAVFIIIFPRFIIYLIAGHQYEHAAPILQLYMITGLIRPMQNQSANLLNSIGKQAICFWMNTIALAANLLINYACLKTIGFYGAAVGSTLTYGLALIAWYFLMRRIINFQARDILKYMLETYKTVYDYGIQWLGLNRVKKDS